MTGQQASGAEAKVPPSAVKRRPLPLHIFRLYPRSFSALLVYALLLALSIGFGSSYWLISGSFPVNEIRAGAWRYWPDIGSSTVDPYARAIIARDAFLPLAIGEGLELTAVEDSSGQPLRSFCRYRIGPTMPAARFWTLTLYNPQNRRPVEVALRRSGLTSAEVVRHENAEFDIALSRQAEPGNWLQLPQEKNFRIILRLYDIPASIDKKAIDHRLLPMITRTGCQP